MSAIIDLPSVPQEEYLFPTTAPGQLEAQDIKSDICFPEAIWAESTEGDSTSASLPTVQLHSLLLAPAGHFKVDLSLPTDPLTTLRSDSISGKLNDPACSLPMTGLMVQINKPSNLELTVHVTLSSLHSELEHCPIITVGDVLMEIYSELHKDDENVHIELAAAVKAGKVHANWPQLATIRAAVYRRTELLQKVGQPLGPSNAKCKYVDLLKTDTMFAGLIAIDDKKFDIPQFKLQLKSNK
ncbi:hypothetical protein MIND_00120100 [Mycena indigotica]|uniref:DUF6699 domain-containing protein n=1 Tax=Mycena indigotica TaxID=2126181 RepID=A0A8H6TEY6_9AGAR|nr:uncharacterized protein MIND_00120100 [Mycena indigotica]KAF7316024.1 hypothetical protein MIND_00120100 [Mycena indigotica]